jgi:molybdopterin-guanine dinucleotide biosynthesis protein A
VRTDVIGIVLAGGQGRRLGLAAPAGGKGALPFRGRSLLETVVATVGAETGRVLVVAAAGQPLPAVPADVLVVRDTEPGAGPLAAVRDGLSAAARLEPRVAAAFVASCDLPLLRHDVVRTILDRQRRSPAAWVVPVVDDRPQPLAAAWPLGLLPRIDRHLAQGRRDIRSLLEALADESAGAVEFCTAPLFAAADPELESFRDIDTPADVSWLRGRENPPSAG